PTPSSPLFPYTTLFRSLFPGQEFVPYQVYARSREGTSQRLRIMTELVLGRPKFVIATPEALCQKLMPKQVFKDSLLKLATGQQRSEEHTSELQSRENLV